MVRKNGALSPGGLITTQFAYNFYNSGAPGSVAFIDGAFVLIYFFFIYWLGAIFISCDWASTGSAILKQDGK